MQKYQRFELSTIVDLIDLFIAQPNKNTLRIQRQFRIMRSCENFIAKFLQLGLSTKLDERQKLVTLINIKKFFGENLMYTFKLHQIQLIINLFNNYSVPEKYKQYLLHLMNKTPPFTIIKHQIKQFIVEQIRKGHITENSIYVLFFSQFILNDNQDYYGQVDYICKARQTLVQIGRHTCVMYQSDRTYIIYLEHTFRTCKLMAVNLKRAPYEVILQFLNSSFCNFIVDCYKMPFEQSNEIKMKTLVCSILKELLIYTPQCYEKYKSEISFMDCIQPIIDETVSLLQKLYKQPQANHEGIKLCLSVITHIYTDRVLSSSVKEIENVDLVRMLLKSLQLRKIDYQNFQLNPFEFINMVKNFFMDEAKSKQEQLVSFGEKSQQFSEYNFNTILIKEICTKKQEFCYSLLQFIIDQLYGDYVVQGFTVSTKLILIGILKQEILKRPQIFQPIKQFLHMVILQRQGVTCSDIEFTICALVCIQFWQYLFDDRQIQCQLFRQICEKIDNPEVTLTIRLLCVEMLMQFLHREEYCPYIFNLSKHAIQGSQHPLIINEYIKMYLQFLKNIALFLIPQVQQSYYDGICAIVDAFSTWIKQQKIAYLIYNTIHLLIQYKMEVQSGRIKGVLEKREADAVNQMIKARSFCLDLQSLRRFFDKCYFASYSAVLESGTIENPQSLKDYEFFLQVFDKNIMSRSKQLFNDYKTVAWALLKYPSLMKRETLAMITQILTFVLLVQPLQTSPNGILLIEKYLVLFGSKMNPSQVSNLSNLFEKEYKTYSYKPKIKASQLLIRMAFFLEAEQMSIQKYSFLLNQLPFCYQLLNNNIRVSQISIYLLCKLMQKFLQRHNLSSLLCQTFKIVIPLIDYNIREKFDTQAKYQQDIYKNRQKGINEWQQFKTLVQQLQQRKRWKELMGTLSCSESEILRKALQCENINNAPRVIYKIKIG